VFHPGKSLSLILFLVQAGDWSHRDPELHSHQPYGGGIPTVHATMSIEAKQKAIDYAKNYPLVLTDSPFTGPVSVGNIGEFDGRVIINLCLRTAKSEPVNATISFPNDWRKATIFKPGDQVNVKIENGYVKNLWHAKAEPVRTGKISAATVNQQVAEAMDEKAAEEAVEEVIAETSQPTTPANQADERPF
jgi:hypothetical protein